MRGLIGCETSGVMRRAFAARGHDMWSVDLLPAEDGSNRHIRGDLRDYLDEGWDFLAVCHPPCTRLCNSGVRWLHVPPPGRSLAEMWAELDEGAALFSACWRAPIARVAIENPVMHKHARARLPADLPRPQIVQPWWFGDPAFKATGWYLRGLPALVPTNRLVPPRKAEEPERHAEWSAIHRASPGPDRWKIRSRTFQGLAEACADQWGGFVDQQQEARNG
ncbi:hypothetical protein [Rhodobacter capsulatus]|jgi:hypothetical protein|nr:hypothetical protein [Rhodobacter capsulatus]ETD01728.1 hypothetical protein U714_11175 [Rhodobacter capsulatus DE442]ETD76796.1 hypothetical protein U717_11330 [Rhodobacter capsulatus R121]ETE53633.1 hypothetical protein U715_11335 [Rhodobacter capsulatus Y262]MDS0927445.1 hypothetical protein [Rhodobacter capsulatus]TQD33672.1 hypothetical protein FKW81_12990 [Rhodobacter capsulatus]